jgi:hypothetical protein
MVMKAPYAYFIVFNELLFFFGYRVAGDPALSSIEL